MYRLFSGQRALEPLTLDVQAVMSCLRVQRTQEHKKSSKRSPLSCLSRPMPPFLPRYLDCQETRLEGVVMFSQISPLGLTASPP